MLRSLSDDAEARNYFGEPVDAVAFHLPDYHDVIKRPMDLGTVSKKLKGGAYGSGDDFAADVRLVFQNAMWYNPPADAIHLAARRLLATFDALYSGDPPQLSSGARRRPPSGPAKCPPRPPSAPPAPPAAAAARRKRSLGTPRAAQARKAPKVDRRLATQVYSEAELWAAPRAGSRGDAAAPAARGRAARGSPAAPSAARGSAAAGGDCPVCYEPLGPDALSFECEHRLCARCGEAMAAVEAARATASVTRRGVLCRCPLCRSRARLAVEIAPA